MAEHRTTAPRRAFLCPERTIVAQDMRLHSFINFFDATEGMVVKPGSTMGSHGCSCPASWNVTAGLPRGVYEDLHCTCDDLIDWPSGDRDGYVSQGNSVSAVANGYIAHSAAVA